MLQGLEDESSTCIRQTLLSLDIALPYLLESKHNVNIPPLLEVLPLLAYNPYWLVKASIVKCFYGYLCSTEFLCVLY